MISSSKKKIVVAYTSGSGHTRKIAESIYHGIDNPEIESALLDIALLDNKGWHKLDEADAIIFGSPTYMGSASATFHSFAEKTSGRWHDRSWRGKFSAGFTNSACKEGDKRSTLEYLFTFAAQHGMIWINHGFMPGWFTVDGTENEINRLGYSLGLGTSSPAGAGLEGVHLWDLKTADAFGKYIAQIILQMK